MIASASVEIARFYGARGLGEDSYRSNLKWCTVRHMVWSRGVWSVPDACENTSTVVRGDATRPLLPAESVAGIGTAMGLNSGSSRAVS